MRRNVVAQTGCAAGGHGLHLPANVVELPLQHGDLFLLPKDGMVERLDKVLGIAELDLEFGETVFQRIYRTGPAGQ